MKPLSQRALACLGALLFLAAGVGEGATVERVTLLYDDLGRAASVGFPGSAAFSLGWTAPLGRLAPITAATVTAPWGQLFEYGLTGGRIATLTAVGVPTVPPEPANGPANPVSVDLTTHFTSTDDGRILTVTDAYGSTRTFTYTPGVVERLARANWLTQTHAANTAPKGASAVDQIVTSATYNLDNIPQQIVNGAGKIIQLPALRFAGVLTPTTVPTAISKYVAEDVITTTTPALYGRPTKIEGGTGELLTTLAYHPDTTEAANKGLLSTVTVGNTISETFDYL